MADRKRDELDSTLDAALAKYAAVEPRAGLEGRVLANLRAGGGREERRWWWRWSVASAAVAITAVLIVATTLAWRSGTRRAPPIAHHPSTSGPRVKETGQVASNRGENSDHQPAPGPTTRRVTHHAHAMIVASAPPKLDRFPSPQPLSEQEKILASYVEKYPEEAVLLARARTEALRQDQLEEMKAFPSGSRVTNSEEENSDSTER
jgi:hypothetical protein